MRILTVSHFFAGHGGGIERVAGHLCHQFNALGATASWAASDSDAAPEGIETVPLRCINPTEKLTGLPMPIPGVRGCRDLAKAVARSDAVIIHDALYVTSILAMLFAKVKRKRIVLIQHIAGIPFSSRVLRAIMRIANLVVTRPMLRAADARVFISDTVRQDLLGSEPSLASDLLFNGVDGRIFHPGANDPVVPEARPRRLLFVGRYVEKKGLEVLRLLAAMRPDREFALVGTGPIKPNDWKLPNVQDLGPKTSTEVADLYRSSDMLILPSVGEGFPLVIQEAMACGLPVVCGAPSERADPAAARWLRGVVIDLERPEDSACRCADAIDSPDLSPDQRAEMAAYAAAHYRWTSMARSLLQLAAGRP